MVQISTGGIFYLFLHGFSFAVPSISMLLSAMQVRFTQIT